VPVREQLNLADLAEAVSDRPNIQFNNQPETNTKTGMVLKSFLAIHKQFTQLKENKHLRIICADDSYLNLEALRVVFQRLGLIDYCVFVSNGQ